VCESVRKQYNNKQDCKNKMRNFHFAPPFPLNMMKTKMMKMMKRSKGSPAPTFPFRGRLAGLFPVQCYGISGRGFATKGNGS